MIDIAVHVAGFIFLCFAVFRITVARTGRIQRCMWVFALCLGFSLLLNAPNTRPAPSLSALLVVLTHGLKLAALTCLALMAAMLDRPPADRTARARHLGVGLVAQLASALLYAASHVIVTDDAVLVRPGRSWAYALYGAIFAAYGCLCVVPLIRVLARHARSAAPGPIRTGLRLMTLACCAGVLWTSWALADALEVLRIGRVGLGEDLMSTLLGVTVALLGVGGASATFWPGVLAVPARWFRARRTFHALEPLWTALYAELPGIALEGPPARRRGGLPWRATFELYRRVVEIRDAYLALRPYAEPETAERITSSARRQDAADARRAAALEADAVAAALENRRLGRRPGAPATETAHPKPHAPPTLADEADWLRQVADAFAHLPEADRLDHRVEPADEH
ncbi:MAB_1171c family putative transporter [Streptomyces griseoviridis]